MTILISCDLNSTISKKIEIFDGKDYSLWFFLYMQTFMKKFPLELIFLVFSIVVLCQHCCKLKMYSISYWIYHL
jgi:hypothetical protein